MGAGKTSRSSWLPKEEAENMLRHRGRIYKKAELEALIAEIDRFVEATGLTPPLHDMDLEFDVFKILEQRPGESTNGEKT